MNLAHYVFKSTIVVSLLLGLSACNLQPNWYAAGKWNYTHQNYTQALPQLLWSAEMGDPDAQYAVGYMYYNGLGTPVDDILAYHWFTQSAKAGNPKASEVLQQIVNGPSTKSISIAKSSTQAQHFVAPIIPPPSQSSLKIGPSTLAPPIATK